MRDIIRVTDGSELQTPSQKEGDKLRDLRLARKLNMREFAARFRIRPADLSDMENGRKPVAEIARFIEQVEESEGFINPQPQLWNITRAQWINAVMMYSSLTYFETTSVQKVNGVWMGTSNCAGPFLLAAIDTGILDPQTDVNMPIEKAIEIFKERTRTIDTLEFRPQKGDLMLFQFPHGPHIAMITPGSLNDPHMTYIFHCSLRSGRCVSHPLPASWLRARKGTFAVKDIID